MAIEQNKKMARLLGRLKQMNDQEPELGPQVLHPATPLLEAQILTLDEKSSISLSPMLRARFEFAGRWENANLCQTWLSLENIAEWFADTNLVEAMRLRRENWDHVPPANVASDKCAIYGFDMEEVEETYLVWRDTRQEPEVWRFVGADYKCFRDLERFLEYLVGDRDADDADQMGART